MKFVCENCKAKYQIGDDKVSGKTVRMKCRRCGHLILVSATVTESSVAKHAPAEGAPLGSSMASQPTPPPGSLLAPASLSGVADDDDDENQSTVIMSAPAALRMAPNRPGAPAAPASPGRPSSPPAPRVGGTQAMPATAAQPPRAPSAPGRPPPAKPSVPGRPGGASPFVPAAAPSAPSVADLAQRSMSTAISAAARGTSNPVGPGRGGPQARGHLALAASPSQTPAPSHLTPVPSPTVSVPPAGGVAGAFQRVAAAPPAALRVETPGEDWYVGVGGVPIGPVRLSVIREKVEQGAVDGESLVWREGFEEWQPLRNVPGLRAILDEPRRTNPTPAPDGIAKISSTSHPRVSTSNAHAGGAFGAGAPAPPASHSSLAPSATGPSAETTGHGALSLGNVPTGGVSLGPAISPTGDAHPAPLPATEPSGGLAPAIGAAGLAKPVSIAPPSPSIPPPSRTDRKKGMHPFAYAMIAMAAVFGGVAAWVLLIKAPPPPVVVVKTVTADPGLNAAPPPPPTTSVGDPAPSASVAVDPKSGQPTPGTGGPRPATSVASTKPGDPPPPNADSFGGPSGPTNGPSTTNNGGGNGKLSEGEIQGVVSRNQSRVRRACWQPALDASSGTGAKSARVSTTITIGPGGNVTSANASGAENFPGLASCVGAQIRGWTFPKSDGSTTVNVPFSFNAQ